MPTGNPTTAAPAPTDGAPLPITAGRLRQLLAEVPADKPLLIFPPEDDCEVMVAGVDTDGADWGHGAGMETETRYFVLTTTPVPVELNHFPSRDQPVPTVPDPAEPTMEATEVEDPPFTEASRARLVLAAALAALADDAAGLVPIVEGVLTADGKAVYGAETVREVASFVAAARALLPAAAVAARLGGVTWVEIGAALEVSAQAAQERFSDDETRFRDEQHSPENPHYTGDLGEVPYRLAGAALHPASAAAELDAWVRRRQATDGGTPEPAPVSGGLARMNPQAELRWISDHSHSLWAKAEATGAGTPPLTERITLAERTLACWEQIAAGQQRVSRPVRDRLALARRTLAELKEQAATRGHDTSTASPKTELVPDRPVAELRDQAAQHVGAQGNDG
jgi:hypothetical protein